VVFRFLLHFPFLFGENYAESLYAQIILDTLDFPAPTTEVMSLTLIDVCSLKATIFACFFGVMSIFTLTKTKNYPRVQNQHALAKGTSCQLMKWQPFASEPVCKPVPISQGHAFTEIRGKKSVFDYLQLTELDFYQNECLSQLICTLLYFCIQGNSTASKTCMFNTDNPVQIFLFIFLGASVL
jgi:hypothetical protein